MYTEIKYTTHSIKSKRDVRVEINWSRRLRREHSSYGQYLDFKAKTIVLLCWNRITYLEITMSNFSNENMNREPQVLVSRRRHFPYRSASEFSFLNTYL